MRGTLSMAKSMFQSVQKHVSQSSCMFSLPSMQRTHIRLIGPRKYSDFRDLRHPMPCPLFLIIMIQFYVFGAIQFCVHGRSMVVSGLQSSHSYSHPLPVLHNLRSGTWLITAVHVEPAHYRLFYSCLSVPSPIEGTHLSSRLKGLHNSKTRKCQAEASLNSIS
jgi:hypothetical protein